LRLPSHDAVVPASGLRRRRAIRGTHGPRSSASRRVRSAAHRRRHRAGRGRAEVTATARRAAIEERLANATPGPWFRPLDTRSKASVTARLPDDEPGTFADRLDIDGNPERVAVVQCATWSSGKHVRK